MILLGIILTLLFGVPGLLFSIFLAIVMSSNKKNN